MTTYTVAASGADSSAGSLSIGKGPTNSTVTSLTANPLPIGRHSGTNDCTSAAFRFTGITETGTIASAVFSMVADVTYNAGANPIVYVVSCQAADNAAALSATSGDINATTRPRTTADSGNWTVTSVTGGTRYSIDITAAVQEVLNRGGWASGNAIVVIVDTATGSTVNNEWQDWRAYDAATSGDEAQLVITVAGTNFPRSVSSSVSHTYAGTQRRAAARGVAGSISHTYAGTQRRAAARGVASSIASSAAITRAGAAIGRSISSSISHALTLARAGVFRRTLSSSIASSAAIARAGAAIGRSISSSIASAATWARRGTFGRALSSTIAQSTAINYAGALTDWEVSAGSGYTDGSPRQLVRTSANRLYVFASNCDSYPCTATSQTLRAYKATSAGVPAGFTRQNSAGESSAVSQWAVAIDASDVIHVAFTTRSTNGGNVTALKYTTFDPASDTWSGTVTTIATLNCNGGGQGDETVALALDSDGVPHVVYLDGSTAATRRAYYRNRVGGTWSSATQIDSGVTYTGNQGAWHPNLAFDTSGQILAAFQRGAFNNDADGVLYTRVRSTGGTWGSTVQVATGLHVGIDQCSSLLVTPDNTYHVAVILPETPTYQSSLIRYYYSTNSGASWSANHPTDTASHNPVLGYANGKVRIYAHGVPDGSNHGQNLYYFQGDGGAASWGAWTQFHAGTNFDSSINVRWAQYHNAYPNTIDIAYWDDNYPNNLYTGTSIGMSALSRAISSTIAHALTLARQLGARRSISSSVSHLGAVGRLVARARNVGSVIASAAALARSGVFGRVLGSTIASAASIVTGGAALRALSSTIAHAASIARAGVFGRSVTIATSHATALARRVGALRAMSSAIGHAAALARSGAFLRGLSSSIASAAAIVGERSGAGALARSISSTIGHAAALARSGAFGRSVASSTSHLGAVGRLVAAARGVGSTIAHASAAAGAAARARAVLSAIASSSTASRALVLGRAVTSAIAHVATLVRGGIITPTIKHPTRATLTSSGETRARASGGDTRAEVE